MKEIQEKGDTVNEEEEGLSHGKQILGQYLMKTPIGSKEAEDLL